MQIKVGDYIGALYRKQAPDGKQIWYLCDARVTKIVQNSRGTKVYSKRFYPIDLEDIETNTELMAEADGWILTREVMLLTPDVRAKCEAWVKWANDNPDKAVGLISGE